MTNIAPIQWTKGLASNSIVQRRWCWPPGKIKSKWSTTLSPSLCHNLVKLCKSLEREASSLEARLGAARADLQKADDVRASLERLREEDEVNIRQHKGA